MLKLYYTYKLKKLLREVCYLIEVKKRVNIIKTYQLSIEISKYAEKLNIPQDELPMVVDLIEKNYLIYWDCSKKKAQRVRKFCGYKSVRIKNLRSEI